MRWRKGENRDREPVIRGIQRLRHRHHAYKYDREGKKGGGERRRGRRKREMKREARMRKEGRDTEERKLDPELLRGPTPSTTAPSPKFSRSS